MTNVITLRLLLLAGPKPPAKRPLVDEDTPLDGPLRTWFKLPKSTAFPVVGISNLLIVSVYGLNDKIGNITYYDSSGQTDYNFTKPYSEETAKKIDEEISLIIEKQYNRACNILKKNKSKLSELAKRLLEKEVIFKEDLIKILGERPFKKDEETNNKK